jgi:hypothetical protein
MRAQGVEEFLSSREVRVWSHSRRLKIAALHSPFTLWSAPAGPDAECARLFLVELTCPLRPSRGAGFFAFRFQATHPGPSSIAQRCPSSADRVFRSAPRSSLRPDGISGVDLRRNAPSFPRALPHSRFVLAHIVPLDGCLEIPRAGVRKRASANGFQKMGFPKKQRGTTSIPAP